MKTLLISMPWARRDIMSIQLGSLKAYLTEQGFDVDSRHYYKDIEGYIGRDYCSDIVVNCLGDLIFSPLYSEEKEKNVREHLQKFFGESFNYEEFYSNMREYIHDILFNDVDWNEYTNVAFTTSLVQFIPSLYLAREIKAIKPTMNIIFGGASLVDDMAQNVSKIFENVDFVIKGEGELTLTELLKYIEAGNDSYSEIKGLVYREKDGTVVNNQDRELISNLDILPAPDFDDYFNYQLDKSEFYPAMITVEASRGCFWGKCSFCNLNSQWHNTCRLKSADKVAEEIRNQSQKYKTLEFFFTDSNVSNKKRLFQKLKSQNRDYIFHAEVSGHLDRNAFVAMRNAGIRDIQIGIEAFNSSLLKKYNKGVSVMRNIEMLKWCCELGISVFYNVISGFPTTTQEEVDNTFLNMQYAQYYQPPVITGYCLSYESPVYNDYKQYNIKSWSVSEELKSIYNEVFLGDTAPLLNAIVGYDVILEEKIDANWDSVIDFSDYWEKTFEKNRGKSALVYCEGGDFIIVRKQLFDRDEQYTLEGVAREIYLFCMDESRSISDISKKFDTLSEEEVSELIDELVELEIMFREGDLCFSLATRIEQRAYEE